jgi:hypothetical protein
MTNKLVVVINSLKTPKFKKILLYEMKFLVPNYSCLQNPWLGDYCPQKSVLSVLNWICWTPPKEIPGYAADMVPCTLAFWYLCTNLYGFVSQTIHIFVCTFLFAETYSVSSKYQHQIFCLGTCITSLMKIFHTLEAMKNTWGYRQILCVCFITDCVLNEHLSSQFPSKACKIMWKLYLE